MESKDEPYYSAADVARLVEAAKKSQRAATMATVKRVFDDRVKLCETRASEYAGEVTREASVGRWVNAQAHAAKRDSYSERASYLDGFLSEVLRAIREAPIDTETAPCDGMPAEVPHADA